MIKKFKSNSGFTLIEMIIAMAVLAFLMTAISSLMGTSMMSYKKSKADIGVQTSAQETYNSLTDTIMQASNVVVKGYVTNSPIDFSVNGAATPLTPSINYYVRDDEQKAAVLAKYTDANDTNVLLFTELSPDDVIYVDKIMVDTAMTMDVSAIPASRISANGAGGYTLDPSTSDAASLSVIYNPTTGVMVGYSMNDTVTHIYSFVNNNLYYEKEHKYMTTLDDKVSDWTDPEKAALCIYNENFRYVTIGATSNSISACMLTVDASSNSFGLEFSFENKNMIYNTLGMVNIRNSFVLKPMN